MGRQLQGISGTGLTASYKYNENGLRTEKTVNGQKHEYTYLGSNVTREIIRDELGEILWTIHYSYAGSNSPVSMNVNGTEYYFLKNAQGDISHVVDADGNEVASYEYDAWGNHLSVTGGDIAELNPYRYRGYRFDTDTGLYYLQSRYYNPEWGRFINADVIVASGQMANMFAFCFNNPVNYIDGTGLWPTWGQVGGVLAGMAILTVGIAAAVVAAPVLATAITVGYVAVAVYATGAVVCGLVAVACGGSIVSEAVTGENRLRDYIGQSNFDDLTVLSTGGSLYGFSAATKSGIKPTGFKKSLDDINKEIKPPGWNEKWRWDYPASGSGGKRWFDTRGGEWRWHSPDRWHEQGHWDHNPWTNWNSPWQNIYPR